jgi:hypothetical protein
MVFATGPKLGPGGPAPSRAAYVATWLERLGWAGNTGWRPTSAWAGLGLGLAGATETEGHGGQLRRGSGGPAERAALAMRAGTGTTHGTSERG